MFIPKKDRRDPSAFHLQALKKRDSIICINLIKFFKSMTNLDLFETSALENGLAKIQLPEHPRPKRLSPGPYSFMKGSSR